MGNNISKISKEYDTRYIEGKIYTITCKDGAVYVGSTIETLKVRFGRHKSKDTKCYMYKYIHNNYDGDWSKCKIKLYENYPCNNEYELNRREGNIIRLFGTINKQIAGRTDKEWYEDNREIILEKKKEYYEDNKEIILEKRKEYKKGYYEDNKETILEKKKEYYEENKEIIAERNKRYYEENKEIINEKRKEKVECDCGCIIRKDELVRHLKTQRHKDLMEKQISSILSFLESIQECL